MLRVKKPSAREAAKFAAGGRVVKDNKRNGSCSSFAWKESAVE